MDTTPLNISPDDPHLGTDNRITYDGQLKTTVIPIDELPEEQRNQLLGVKPAPIRVISATGWFRKCI